jgi:hypothetical protein
MDKTIYENHVIEDIMIYFMNNINEKLYNNKFMEYLYENFQDPNILINAEYLRKNLYSFHLKGSSAFVQLMKMYESGKRRKYTSDFDSICVVNPYYFRDIKTFGYFRFLMIIGIIQALVEISNDDEESFILNEKLRKEDLYVEKECKKGKIEIVHTGISQDDVHFDSFFNNIRYDEHTYTIEDIQISEKSLYKIKILTNITNQITSHMLISIELKTIVPLHIFDIVIPTSTSPSLYYEWLLSQNTQLVEMHKMNYLSCNSDFLLFQVEKVCKYYILNIDLFYIDQLYSSHYLTIETGMKNYNKYENRLKRAFYIMKYLFDVSDYYRIIQKYGSLVLPTKIKLIDLLIGITNLHMILDI